MRATCPHCNNKLIACLTDKLDPWHRNYCKCLYDNYTFTVDFRDEGILSETVYIDSYRIKNNYLPYPDHIGEFQPHCKIYFMDYNAAYIMKILAYIETPINLHLDNLPKLKEAIASYLIFA